jgi:hypothetical protein
MPQPFSFILPNAKVTQTEDALEDKPEMAVLVSKIFATWATIEHELSLLLMRVLGADAAPAIAMHETLTAQHLQVRALQAAAQAALEPEVFDIFQAAIAVTESAQTPRNHLAHWMWGKCEQKPELLALGDPKSFKIRAARITKAIEEKRAITRIDAAVDPAWVLAYSKGDLVRALRDLKEALEILSTVGLYIHLRKVALRTQTAAEVAALEASTLQLLSEKRLFREALARIRKGRGSTPPPSGGSHPPSPAGS